MVRGLALTFSNLRAEKARGFAVKLRQRDMSARPAKLRQRDLFARSALTACDLGREHDSWQCGGRQCRRLIAFVLLAMIVV